MNRLVNIINNQYKFILQDKENPDYHIFFRSHDWVKKYHDDKKKIYKDYYKEYKNYEYNNSEIPIFKTIENCKYIPKKIISKTKLNEIYEIISNPEITDFNIIRKNLDEMYNYLLPSSINNLSEYENSINKNDINIIIIGCGPVGLYTALYLNEYYNKSNIFNFKINILLIDNRIKEEGIKMHYSRLTEFNFDNSEIVIFIKQIFCWKNKLMTTKVSQFDYINILENLFYLSAFHNKIKMYFTKKLETYDELKKFSIKNNINYIFDCTGGRININFNNKIKWNDFKFKKDNYEVKLCNDNYYHFFVDNKLYERISVVLQLLDNNKKEIPVGNIFGETNFEEDKKILDIYKNKCFTKNEYIKLSKYFKDSNLRNLLPRILDMMKYNLNNIKYIKLNYFITNSHHRNFCAKFVDKKFMYISLGDSLGNSEDYGQSFGMHHSILFSKYICGLIGGFC
jgi:hypothetical protein